MLLKLLLIIGVIVTIYILFFKKKPLSNSQKKEDSQMLGDDLVECSACGTYAAVNDSILSNGKYYCSSECSKKS
jgi:uncharacterized protein